MDAFKRLVDAAHARSIAVIIDAVYAHAHPEFAYNIVYNRAGEDNPMMGRFAEEFFSWAGTDYRKPFTRDYFLAVNRHWLTELHLDGFRYDYVPGIYDGPVGVGYAQLVFETHRLSQDQALRRFAGAGRPQQDHPMRRASARPAGNLVKDLLQYLLAEPPPRPVD